MSEPTPEYVVPRAATPWRALKLEVLLIGVGIAVPLISLCLDISSHRADWFPRSGAVATLAGGILAFRSLGRHYNKFINAFERGFPLATSPNQWKVDILTLALTIAGTLVWAYGDKLLLLLHAVEA